MEETTGAVPAGTDHKLAKSEVVPVEEAIPENPDINHDLNPVKKEYFDGGEAEAEVDKGTEKKDSLKTLKSAIIISGVVIAVVGAVFAITKKLKEK